MSLADYLRLRRWSMPQTANLLKSGRSAVRPRPCPRAGSSCSPPLTCGFAEGRDVCRGPSPPKLSTASGVSVATLRQLQRGTSGRRAQDATLAALSRALGWPDSYLLDVLIGGHRGDEAGPPVETGMTAVYEALRGVETQLATMNDRLQAVEEAVRDNRR
jgi:hypothetical protein